MAETLTRALVSHTTGSKRTTPHPNADLLTYLKGKGNHISIKSMGDDLTCNLVLNGMHEIHTGRMLDGWYFARCGDKMVRVDPRRHVKVTQSMLTAMNRLIEHLGWVEAWKCGFEGVPTRGQEGEQVCMLIYLCEKAMGDAIQLILDIGVMRENASRCARGMPSVPVVDVVPPSHDEKVMFPSGTVPS
jgi:hypothetical protein